MIIYLKFYKGGIEMFTDTRKIQWEYEDQLDLDITDNMFKLSEIVDGVRMYPYIIIDGCRHYLEN